MSEEQLRRDELVSAYLDGEATPAEIAEVEADGALLDRAEQLRAVQSAVAAPVPPLSAEQRDQMISAALAAAESDTEAEADTGRGARFVLLRRPEILVLAAAAALLAAIVSASLITSSGGDYDEAGTAADVATAADADETASAQMAEAPAQELMAEADAAAEMAPEAAMTPAEEAMAEEEPALDEALIVEVEDAAEAELAEAAAAPAEEAVTETPTTAAAEDRDDSADDQAVDGSDPTAPVVDLGPLASLDSLFESIGASPAAVLDDTAAGAPMDPADGATADPGPCSTAVHERVLELGAETIQSFTATVGAEAPVAIDASLVRRVGGGLLIVYAVGPDCEVEVHEPAGP